MGLYIKGLRLPKKGGYTSFTVYSDGRVVFKFGGDHAGQATEVPPHGRLIDADALAVHKFAGAEHDISIEDGGACYRRGWNDAIEAIMENAETIIGGE